MSPLIGIFNPVDGISEGSKLALETPSNIVAASRIELVYERINVLFLGYFMSNILCR